MKQEVSRPVIIIALAVVVLGVAFAGWRFFGGGSGAFNKSDPESIHQLQLKKDAKDDR